MRRSLFLRYWLTLALAATLPIAIAGTLEGWFVYRAGYQNALERQVLEARQAAYQIERSVLPLLDRMAIIASLPWDYETASADEQEREMRRLARQFALVARVQRVGADGKLLASVSTDGRGRALSRSELDALQRVRGENGRQAIVSRANADVPWSVAYVENGTGNALVADLRTDVVNDYVAVSRNGDGSRAFIVDRHGTVLAHPDLAPAYAQANLHDPGMDGDTPMLVSSLAPSVREGSLGEISLPTPLGGGRWVAAYRRIATLDWTVIALSPSKTLRAGIRDAVTRIGLIVLGANLVAVFLALGLARSMTGPLISLAAASERVASGDLTARASVGPQDEIGRVSKQFNSMVDQLHDSYGRLEERVAEKTQQLERANRHKSEFLAQMSHELRTPLNAVIGFSDALKAQYFGELNDKQLDYVRDIHASGQHLLSLINDLLDLAKIEAGRMDVMIGPVDVRRVVDGALALVRGRAETRTIVLTSHLEDDVATWPADERKLKQILLNLLSNAVKFTPDGGAVTIGVQREGDAAGGVLRFAISDTGIGIPADQVSKLFTDFGQIEQGMAGMREGTGLGLALSRRLVELHGGRIWAESAPGHGSTFYFTLPGRK